MSLWYPQTHFIIKFRPLNKIGKMAFFVDLVISRCLATNPHPMNRARGSILLVLYSMIVHLAHHFMFLVAVVRYNHINVYNPPGLPRILFRKNVYFKGLMIAEHFFNINKWFLYFDNP